MNDLTPRDPHALGSSPEAIKTDVNRKGSVAGGPMKLDEHIVGAAKCQLILRSKESPTPAGGNRQLP